MTIAAITENWEKVSTFQFFLDFKPRFARGLHNTVFNINPFHATVLFLYPLKTSGNRYVFEYKHKNAMMKFTLDRFQKKKKSF